MIQRCPKCGAWCEASEDSLVDSFVRGASDIQEAGGDIIGTVGSIFGKSGEKIGRNIGRAIGAAGSVINGGLQALYGDSYNFCCTNCGHEWSCDSELEDQSDEYEHLQGIISLTNQLGDNDPSDAEAIREYIDNISEHLQTETNATNISVLLDIRSVAYWQLDELKEAYNDINHSLEIMDDAHSRALRGLYQFEINQSQSTPTSKSIIAAIADLTSIYDEGHRDRHIPISRLESALESGIEDYVNKFTSLSPSERRFICFTDKIQAMGKHILVLPIGQLPQGITFQEGLPRKNAIYEVHPFKPNHYISLDNFEFDMFNDKIEEFQWIMENLGARKVNVTIESNKSQNVTQAYHSNVRAEGEYGSLGINGGYKKDVNSEKYEELHVSLEQHNEFLPGNIPPHIPDGLLWYHHITDWQKKVDSRLAGRANSFEIRFESKTNQSLSESEAKELEVEMKFISARAKGNFETANDYHIARTDNHIWRIQVEFYPLSEYVKKDYTDSVSMSSNSLQLTTGEKDYLDTYKDFAKDGNISDRERKLLNKLSSQGGLSAARVAELEAMVTLPKKNSWWKTLFGG